MLTEFQKINANKILGCYNTDLNKGGVGSGRKIGTTCSDKDVYENYSPNHKDYSNFDKNDHLDASIIHGRLADKNSQLYNKEKEKYHFNLSEQHLKFAKSSDITHLTLKDPDTKIRDFHGRGEYDGEGIEESQDDDMEKGGVGSGEYYHHKTVTSPWTKKTYTNNHLKSIKNHYEKDKDIDKFCHKNDIIPSDYTWLKNHANNIDDNDLNKSEGDRGGHIIGHTSSGKPIYDPQHYERDFSIDEPDKDGWSKVHYSDYSKEDHQDAAELHGKLSKEKSNESFKHSQQVLDLPDHELFTDKHKDIEDKEMHAHKQSKAHEHARHYHLNEANK